MRAYYKVLDSDLRSAMSQFIGSATVQYEVGRWSDPSVEGTRLFCFPSLSKARDFVGKFPSLRLRIFRCKARNPSAWSRIGISATLDADSIRFAWGKGPAPTNYSTGEAYAILADAIMLTKEVKA